MITTTTEKPTASSLSLIKEVTSNTQSTAAVVEKNVEETKEDRTIDYTLAYKAVHNISSLYFKGPADFQAAIKLGELYCSDRRWRFIHVRPMFTDIDKKPQSNEERQQYA